MELLFPALYQKLSKVAMAMPNVYEKLCFGTPAFYIEKKFFVRLKEDGAIIAVYTTDRDEWMAKNGDLFFITDHYRKHPSLLLVDLKAVSKEDLTTLIKGAWRLRAPNKAVKEYDAFAETIQQ